MIKHILKKVVNTLGYEIRNQRHLELGHSIVQDIQYICAQERFRYVLKHDAVREVILDVGANDGSISLQFVNDFPEAIIHAFEPVSGTFIKLQDRVRKQPRIIAHKLGMGNLEGQKTIYLYDNNSHLSSLVNCTPVIDRSSAQTMEKLRSELSTLSALNQE